MGVVRAQYTGLSDERILSPADQGLEEGEDLVFKPGEVKEVPEELFATLRGGEPGSWLLVREGEEPEPSKDDASDASTSDESEEEEDDAESPTSKAEKPKAGRRQQ
jgi:hypothetical protein